MPHLKDLDCSIELSDSQRTLQEFGTTYGDGFVETFVSVPSKPQSFSIHLTSDKFIAPGISMYVFVDGVYQCNRNRQDLKLRKGSDSRSVVDFRVRQKEEKQKDGSMIAREWKFEKLNTVSADDAPNVCSSNVLENIGCIEVLVLRCAGPRTAKTVSAMNIDGAGDFPAQSLALDGQSDGRSMYDDRLPFFNNPASSSRPPPPVPSYHAPYAETAHNHDTRSQSHHSRDPPPFFSSYDRRPGSHYSDPVSPGARPPSIPSEAYQYGSGPIPAGPMFGSESSFYNTRPSSAVVTNAPGVDPKWLNQVLTEAVKRGVEESRRAATAPAPVEQPTRVFDTQSQPPGAWPASPFPPGVALAPNSEHTQHSNHGTTWGGSQGWTGNEATHVGWDTQSSTDGWGPADETETDTWDTADKRENKSPHERWSRASAPTVHHRSERRPSASATARTHKSRHSKDKSTRTSRSKSRSRRSKWGSQPRSSSEDGDGWTHVEADLDTPTSQEFSDYTVQPSQSRSQYRGSRARSRSDKRSRRTHSAHNKEKRSSRSGWAGRDERDAATTPTIMNAPSTVTHCAHNEEKRSSRSGWAGRDEHDAGATPTIMNAPSTVRAPTAPSQRSSHKAEHAPSIVPTVMPWVPEPSEKSRKHSFGMTSVPPPPFSTVAATAGEHRWGSVSARGKEKDAKDEDSWGLAGSSNDGWGNDDTGWDSNETPNKKEPAAWGPGEDNWDTGKDATLVWDTDKDVKPACNTDKAVKPAWDATDKVLDLQPNPSNPPTPSHRHTSKSLSQYRHLRTSTIPKPHWQFPPAPSSPSPPHPPTLSAKQASDTGIEHHVRLGAGSTYGHAVARPSYLDTLARPYAVFRFKYRSRGVLKRLFGDEVPDTGHLSWSRARREKEWLEECPREEVIERMGRLKMEVEGRGAKRMDGGSVGTESVARGLTEKWVERHSREASEKGKGKGKGGKSEKMGGEGDGWGKGVDGGDGGGGWKETW